MLIVLAIVAVTGAVVASAVAVAVQQSFTSDPIISRSKLLAGCAVLCVVLCVVLCMVLCVVLCVVLCGSLKSSAVGYAYLLSKATFFRPMYSGFDRQDIFLSLLLFRLFPANTAKSSRFGRDGRLNAMTSSLMTYTLKKDSL